MTAASSARCQLDFAGWEEQKKNTFLYLGKKTEGTYLLNPRKIPPVLDIEQQMEGLGQRAGATGSR